MTDTTTDTEQEPLTLRRRLARALADEYGPLSDEDDWQTAVDEVILPLVENFYEPYPRTEGNGTVVIGPECIATPDGRVIAWKGEHYATEAWHCERALADAHPGELLVLPDNGDLTADQQRRVNALSRARDVLESRDAKPFAGASTEVDAIDLHNIAGFIITGDDPWAPHRPTRRRWWGGRR